MIVGVVMGWVLSPSIVRTARKEHRCGRSTHDGEGRVYCPRPIEAGSRYVEYLGEAAGYQSGKRYHLDCARMVGVLRSEQPYWHTGSCRVLYTERVEDGRQCSCGGQPGPYEQVPL